MALNEQVMEMTTLFVLPRTESLPPGVNFVRQREQRRRPCLQTARPSDSGTTSYEQALKSMRLFASKVTPRVRNAVKE